MGVFVKIFSFLGEKSYGFCGFEEEERRPMNERPKNLSIGDRGGLGLSVPPLLHHLRGKIFFCKKKIIIFLFKHCSCTMIIKRLVMRLELQ